jgi:hypothetical protein
MFEREISWTPVFRYSDVEKPFIPKSHDCCEEAIHRSGCHWRYLIAIVVLLPFALIGIVAVSSQITKAATHSSMVQHSTSGPMYEAVPQIAASPICRAKDYTFVGNTSTTSAAWASLTRGIHGFVRVDSLPPSITLQQPALIKNGTNVYSITAFHQLHCLQMMRLAWLTPTELQDPVMFSEEHIDHCYDYLRQAVMCTADSTLEGVDKGSDLGTEATNGWGVVHMCRSWDKLVEFVESHDIGSST